MLCVDAIQEFRKQFWQVFRRPQLETYRFETVWEDLELTSDSLAGPLHEIYTKGECDYVFRERLRFPTIRDADGFLKWCLSHPREYRRGALRVAPTNDAEKRDQERLLECAAGMERLSHLAYEVVKQRESGVGARARGFLHRGASSRSKRG